MGHWTKVKISNFVKLYSLFSNKKFIVSLQLPCVQDIQMVVQYHHHQPALNEYLTLSACFYKRAKSKLPQSNLQILSLHPETFDSISGKISLS